ncbi:hypothetical protein ACMA1I_03215 [Pontibacter sp. 13R65]|uniref:hypothetical protein n=1 Tax=Pontibacter sp. 13R65 TaxID=3127458 RepID=UPI00301C63F4
MITFGAYGQAEEVAERVVGSVYIGPTYTVPIGDYRQAYPHANALGGTFGLLLNPRKYPSPLEVGLQVSYLSQGIDKNRSSYSSAYPILKTSHSQVPLHLVARVKPLKEMRIMPYIEGLAGITIFNTRTKLKEDIFDFMRDDHEAVVLDRYRTTVISFGVGAGLRFWGNKSKTAYTDLRVTYLQSPFTNYVKKGDVRVLLDGFPDYHLTRSETNMLLINLNLVGVLTQ